MKRGDDPRHEARVDAVKALFEISFRPKLNVKQSPLVREVLEKREEIDKIIEASAPSWPLEQIAPIDLSVLRLAIFELLHKEKKEPYKVIVDEAVEIAKQYGDKSSPSFVNGVLGTVIKGSKKIK